MRQLVRGVALALVSLAWSAAVVAAAPEVGASEQPGPFEGTFEGTAYGAGGTTAPLALTLTQRGAEVNGTAGLGEGLYVATAGCGGAPVPGATVQGSGQTSPDNPNRVTVRSALEVQGFSIPLLLTGDLAPDGQSIAATATLDVPSFCGPDPALPGTLQRTAGPPAPAA
jgi:hypothetical protein